MKAIIPSNRVSQIPSYLFARIDILKQEAMQSGADVINLGIGDPDLPTPNHIIRTLQKAVLNPKYHQYPPYEGFLFFREAASQWLKNRFNINFDTNKEILALIGTKEGIGHIPWAFVNPGDYVLVPDPGYPVYGIGTILAGGIVYPVPLLEKNNFLPDLDGIPKNIAKKAKLFWINYPNNPTGAVATKKFFDEISDFCNLYKIILCHDAAYSEIYYDNKPALSLFNSTNAKNIGIEFHSLSKTYNMTGWRIGFACGNPDIIAQLGKIKNNMDSGIFGAIQETGATALTSKQNIVDKLRKIYQSRRDILVNGLRNIGWRVSIPQGGFYIWIPIPKKYKSIDFTVKILQETGIVTTPGIGFGKYGEGYIRMTITTTESRLKEALSRLAELKT